MTPMRFKQANKTLLRPSNMTEKECKSLPVWVDGKQVISCWKMSWKQRIKALLFGRVWLCVLSGCTSQPPVWLDCDRTVFEEEATG